MLLCKPYLIENRWKNLQLPMKKYSVSMSLLTVENKSYGFENFTRTAFAKDCQYREKDYENKILVINREHYR